MANIVILGVRGFVGSAVARVLQAQGDRVAGLARTPEAAAELKAAGIDPVEGDLDRIDALAAELPRFDGVVFAPTVPFESEAEIASALIKPLEGSGKPFIFTSGTAVLSLESEQGQWHEESFAEDEPFTPPSWIATRVDTENMVRGAVDRGVRAMVIRPPLIWGHGGSKQIPAIFDSIEKTGSACYLGAGLNLYSNVHVDDLAEVYRLALEKGVGGALYHAVGGEANFRSIAEAAASVKGVAARSIDLAEAKRVWGERIGPLFFAVSSRSRAARTRRELGWVPQHLDVIDDIRNGSYKAQYGA